MSKTEELEKELLEEKQKDLQKRVEGFNGEMIKLLGKYKLSLGAVALISNDGRILARPQLFDDSKPKQSQPGQKQAEPKKEEPIKE
jgi:hypothetical protein